MTNEDLLRFEEIMTEIEVLADEALQLIDSESMIHRRAASYWHPTIIGCVHGRATMTPMQETLDELKQELGE